MKTPLVCMWDAVLEFLGDETKAGLFVIIIAFLALVASNSPLSDIYSQLSHAHFGPSALGLNLSVHEWAVDGLLAIFFFVVDLGLRTELVIRALRDMEEAALPTLTAAFGMLGPALVCAAFQAVTGSGAWNGWVVPTATDIAFTVAILSVSGKGMPPAARAFLLTLAVIDDLLAILVIAFFSSPGLNLIALFTSFAFTGLFGLLTSEGVHRPWILIPVGVVAWTCMLNSGVHATIAGVLLDLVALATHTRRGQMTHELAHTVGPWSAGLVLPAFASFAAEVSVSEAEGGLFGALGDPVTLGTALVLPPRKFFGIWESVWALTKWTKLRLAHGIDLPDVAAVALPARIGFMVAVLIGGLAFTDKLLIAHAHLGVVVRTFAFMILGATASKMHISVHVRGDAVEQKKR